MTAQAIPSVLVFHSYPKKPCVDGLLSTLIFMQLEQNKSKKFDLVPYARTEFDFQAVKRAIHKAKEQGVPLFNVVYMDCAPELPDEVQYLKAELAEGRMLLTVYDHHPLRPDSPFHDLDHTKNCILHIDLEKCVAKTMFEMLLDKTTMMDGCDITDLVSFMQFSEYEGMNPNLSGKEDVTKIAMKIFGVRTNDRILTDDAMIPYYLLDDLIPNQQGWEFLYISSVDSLMFMARTDAYFKNCVKVLAGQSDHTNLEKQKAYMRLLEEADEVLKNGKVLQLKNILTETNEPNEILSSESCEKQEIMELGNRVLIVKIDIMKYGRSLEPLVRKILEWCCAGYAILCNPPSRRGNDSYYYFSLRRVSVGQNARFLAEFVKAVSGSRIGGGHPWASGVTLNQTEYDLFVSVIARIKKD